MKFMKKPVIITAVSVLAVSGAFFSQSTYAAQASKSIKAVYNNIKIVANGSEVAYDAKTEPFMIDGTTYLPLRMIGTALDKKVSWDGTNKRVVIEDNAILVDASTVTALNNQITALNTELNSVKTASATKDATIAQLQKDKTSLQDQLDKKGSKGSRGSSSSSSLRDLEDDLNDDYENYQSTGSVITLKGSKSDVKMTIDVTERKWNALSKSKQTDYIQDIVDDILDTYKDADISGTVVGSSNKLATISVSRKGVVSLSQKSSSLDNDSIRSMLANRYGTYKGYSFSFKVDGSNSDEAIVKATVSRNDWNSLSSSQKSSFKSYIIDDVKDEGVTSVVGYIYASDNGGQMDRFSN